MRVGLFLLYGYNIGQIMWIITRYGRVAGKALPRHIMVVGVAYLLALTQCAYQNVVRVGDSWTWYIPINAVIMLTSIYAMYLDDHAPEELPQARAHRPEGRRLMVLMRNGVNVDDPRLGRLARLRRPQPPVAGRGAARRRPRPQMGARSLPAKYHLPGPTLDQLREGQCMAEGCTDIHNGRPKPLTPTITDWATRNGFYHDAQHRDPWRGCAKGSSCPIEPLTGTSYGGTSTLAGMLEGRARGWWSEFRWIGAGSGSLENDIIFALRDVGPIGFGIPWHESMYETHPDGLVEVDGAEVGGHFINGFEWVPRLRLPKSFKGTKPPSPGTTAGATTTASAADVAPASASTADDLLQLVGGGRGEGAVPIK